MAFVAELRRGHGEHAPELAAADDPDGGAGCKCHSGLSAMPSVWRRTQASSLSARASSAVARVAAAISPPLASPALPVATGRSEERRGGKEGHSTLRPRR